MNKATKIFIALTTLLIISGCMHPMENPYFTVKPSGLNWLEIRRYNVSEQTRRVRVRIAGNGVVTVREGTSPLVGNPFAYDTSHASWADIRETNLNIPPDEALFLFQSLVDYGLFDRQEKPREEHFKSDLYYFSANIQNKTASSSDPVTDPELIERMNMIVRMFYRPTPIRKR